MFALEFGFATLSVLSQCAHVVEASGDGFLGTARNEGRSIMITQVKSDIEVIEKASVNGGKARQRLAKIESSMSRTFQALPKNVAGRLAPRAVRHIVHTYLAKEHGWIIKGLEPQGWQSNFSELHEMNVLQEMAPALVESLLESRQSNRGLSLKDVVIMAAVVERLIFDHNLVMLEDAFELNGLSFLEDIDENNLHEILKSYLLIYDEGRQNVNRTDVSDHLSKKTQLDQNKVDEWFAVIEFERDAVGDFSYMHRSFVNPFKPRQFSFDDVSELVEMLAERYGKWQNIECRQMKEVLMHLSSNCSGRVPLKIFYEQTETQEFAFTESPDYLREIGAMEESVSGSDVLLVNYVNGPSNCVSPSGFHSVCCISDCEGLMNEIEGNVQQSIVQPFQILEIVANLSSPSVDSGRKLPEDLVERLHSIADQSAGVVHLHGRMFAQWLHYAFPNDCPYPHTILNYVDALNASFLDSEEKQRHLELEQQPYEKTSVERMSMRQWSDDEVLPFSEPENGAGCTVLRFAVMLGLCFGVYHVAMQMCRSVSAVADGTYGSKRLPYHVTQAAASHYV